VRAPVVQAERRRRVGEGKAALGHHLHQVTEAQLEAQIPPHTKDNDLTLEMPTLEQLIKAGQLLRHHPSPIPPPPKIPGSPTLHQSRLQDDGSLEIEIIFDNCEDATLVGRRSFAVSCSTAR
jgi:hypothetical protein